jgi:hypothetical protein
MLDDTHQIQVGDHSIDAESGKQITLNIGWFDLVKKHPGLFGIEMHGTSRHGIAASGEMQLGMTIQGHRFISERA